jgi:hypothetical protein
VELSSAVGSLFEGFGWTLLEGPPADVERGFESEYEALDTPVDPQVALDVFGLDSIELGVVVAMAIHGPATDTVAVDANLYLTAHEKIRCTPMYLCDGRLRRPPALRDVVPMLGDALKVELARPTIDPLALADPSSSATIVTDVEEMYAEVSFGRQAEVVQGRALRIQGGLWMLRAQALAAIVQQTPETARVAAAETSVEQYVRDAGAPVAVY